MKIKLLILALLITVAGYGQRDTIGKAGMIQVSDGKTWEWVYPETFEKSDKPLRKSSKVELSRYQTNLDWFELIPGFYPDTFPINTWRTLEIKKGEPSLVIGNDNEIEFVAGPGVSLIQHGNWVTIEIDESLIPTQSLFRDTTSVQVGWLFYLSSHGKPTVTKNARLYTFQEYQTKKGKIIENNSVILFKPNK